MRQTQDGEKSRLTHAAYGWDKQRRVHPGVW